MRKLVINNPVLEPTYQTFLSSAYSSGVTLTVVSSNSYSANDIAVVGQPTEETTEVKKISAVPTDLSLTLASALKFSHPVDTPIYKTLWDFVEIEADTGSGFAVVTQSPIQYDNRDNKTIYNHSSGTNSTSYRFRFYNSVTSTYSEYSPTLTGSLPESNTVGFMISSVRRILNDPDGRIVSDAEIIRDFNEAQDIIYAKRRDWWFLKFENSSITSVANQATYNLDLLGGGSAGSPGISLGYLDLVKYTLVKGSENVTYDLKYLPEVEFDAKTRDNNRTGEDHIIWYTMKSPDSSSDNGYIKVEPIPTTASGTFTIVGWKKIPSLDDVADITVVPLPALLENYAISKGFRVKGIDQKASDYEDRFFGPAPARKRFDALMGIPMLENLNQAQKRPRGQGQQLVRFRGRRSFYGTSRIDQEYIANQRVSGSWD